MRLVKSFRFVFLVEFIGHLGAYPTTGASERKIANLHLRKSTPGVREIGHADVCYPLDDPVKYLRCLEKGAAGEVVDLDFTVGAFLDFFAELGAKFSHAVSWREVVVVRELDFRR